MKKRIGLCVLALSCLLTVFLPAAAAATPNTEITHKTLRSSPSGWHYTGGSWYFYENGTMVKNAWRKDSIGWVYLGEDGAMLTNSWCKDSKGWCYVGANGYAVTNCWKKDSKGWVYLDANGSMVYNKWVKDSVGWCYVGADGYMVTNKWVRDSVGWCYIGANGYAVTNCWKQDSTGKWCHLNANGSMDYNKWIADSKGWCYVGADGYCLTNTWKQDSVGWVYLNSEGSMVYSCWIEDTLGRRYVDHRGYMLRCCPKDGGCIGMDGYWSAQHPFLSGKCTSCGTTTAQRTEEMPNKLLVSDVTWLPVASQEMDTNQRRQLCLDFFELQLGFHWRTSFDVTDWDTTYADKAGTNQLLTANLYGGIPYQSTGSGNLYRWLEYYDEQTGIMDLERAFAENGGYGEGAAVTGVKKDASGNITYKKYRSFQTLFNQCSLSAAWAWGRVINSANFTYSSGINASNGFIPVGCYDYGYDYEGVHYGPARIRIWGEKNTDNPTGYDTPDAVRDILAAGGKNALYECYALLKPADCLVNTGHVRMVKSVELVYRSDGTPDYTASTVTCLEQIEGWGVKDTTVGERPYFRQGGIDKVYTFEALQKSNYLPFTFLELLDENDPRDKAHLDYYYSYAADLVVWKGKYSVITPEDDICGQAVEKARLYTTLEEGRTSITVEELQGMTLAANYSISDVFVTVTDEEGNILTRNIFRALKTTNDREVSMTENNSTWKKGTNGVLLDMTADLDIYDGHGNTVTVTVRVSTGELLTAFSGILE